MPTSRDTPDNTANLDVINAFPLSLRQLLEAELAAGNRIAAVGHTHPAPPVGAFIRLERPVSTRSRATADGLDFWERNSSQYSGEFTDAKREYWILEPPTVSSDYPDMDRIREEANHGRIDATTTAPVPVADAGATAQAGHAVGPNADPLTRFFESMQLDYDRWRDGDGYDLDALRARSPAQMAAAEARLTPPQAWRDVEALATLGTPTAMAALREAFSQDSVEVRMQVLRHAPELVSETERTNAMVSAISGAEPYGGLTDTMTQIAEFHPPPVMAALFTALLTAPGTVAYHYAAMLATLHGAATSPDDDTLRPLYLAFNTSDNTERRDALTALCRTLGLDPHAKLAEVNDSLATQKGDLAPADSSVHRNRLGD